MRLTLITTGISIIGIIISVVALSIPRRAVLHVLPDGGSLALPARGTREDPILRGRTYCHLKNEETATYGGKAWFIHQDGDVWVLYDPDSQEWITFSGNCVIWHGVE